MTDLEISKALALAIGWPEDAVALHTDMWEVMVHAQPNPFGWEVFNYRDWNVIGPIAERFDCFPCTGSNGWLCYDVWADTPQKAIALAVIQGTKK